MNIVGSLPIWIWIVIAIAGGAGYLFSGLIFVFLPFLLAYKEPFRILCIVICLGGTFMCGGSGVTAVVQAQLKEAQAEVAKAEAASKDLNAKLDAERQKKSSDILDREVAIQGRVKALASRIDKECVIDSDVAKILNDAAKKIGDKK
jgi:uncharacterized protein YacL